MEDKKDQQQLDSIYDLYALVTDTYSSNSLITRDFTLGKLQENLLQNKIVKFIVEQLKTIEITKDFLIIPKEKLNQIYTPETTKKIYDLIKIRADKTSKALMGEIESMIILSRGEGEILKSILEHGKQTPIPIQEETQDQKDQQTQL